MIKAILVMLASYLLGSIPFGLLTTKLVKDVDVRDYGSGNIGATNVYRVLGLGGGILVLILDAGKGAVAVMLAQSVLGQPILFLLAGLLAVAGHNLSLFLGFNGGRGVATSVGVLGSLAPLAMLITFFVWLALVVTTRYVSLGSITGAALLPILMLAFNQSWLVIGFTLLISVFVIYSHKPNINRLLNGNENKVSLKLTPDDEQ